MMWAADSVAKARAKEARETNADLEKAKGEIVVLSKKEHQRSKEKSAAAYALDSASVIVLAYAITEV